MVRCGRSRGEQAPRGRERGTSARSVRESVRGSEHLRLGSSSAHRGASFRLSVSVQPCTAVSARAGVLRTEPRSVADVRGDVEPRPRVVDDHLGVCACASGVRRRRAGGVARMQLSDCAFWDASLRKSLLTEPEPSRPPLRAQSPSKHARSAPSVPFALCTHRTRKPQVPRRPHVAERLNGVHDGHAVHGLAVAGPSADSAVEAAGDDVLELPVNGDLCMKNGREERRK